jgi:hypothetical protein
MAEAKFEKVTQSSKPLYGPRKFLLCGFPVGAQSKFRTVLEMAGLASVPVVWASKDQAGDRLSDLFERQDRSGEGVASGLPRVVIVAGITENELHRFMAVCRKTGMKQSLWAALTPTSENWTLQELLTELSAEREAMERRKK